MTMAEAATTAVLRPPAILAAERLIDEVLERADEYFSDLRRPLGWFSDRYDPHHREHLILLASALLEEDVDLDGFVCWLPELKLCAAYTRCRQTISGEGLEAARCSLIQELEDLLDASSDPSLNLLAEKTIGSCLKDIKDMVGSTLRSRVHRVLGGVQSVHEKSVNALNHGASRREIKERARGVRERAPTIQAFYRLQSTMKLPQVRWWCVKRILKKVKERLGQSQSNLARPHRNAPGLSSSTAVPAASGPTETRSRSLESSDDLSPLPMPFPRSRVDDTPTHGPFLQPEVCSCFGLPFWRRRSRQLRRLELVPMEPSERTKETERSSLSCTIPTLKISIDSSQPGLAVTFESGYSLKELLELETAYRAYKQTPKHLRELEAGPEGPLPSLLPASLPITCGHSDCVGDIAELERSEGICPHCYRPIMSRCGQIGCHEEHLHLDVHGRDIECPSCGGKNLNLYWRCDEHRAQGYLSKLTDSYCPECLRQWAGRSRPRRPERIRNGVLRCPRCANDGSRGGDEQGQPFFVPQRVHQLVTSRRPIERSAANQDLCLAAGLSADGECPVCSARLVPFIDPEHCCSEGDPPPPNLPCGCCGFPLAPAARHCPRCRLRVGVCAVCEVVPRRGLDFGAARPPEAWLHRRGSHVACERCATVQFPLHHGADLEDLDGLVCRNVYGCPIGGGLASTDLLALVAPGLKVCPVCEDPYLLPIGLRAFTAEVCRCAFCSTALGDPRHWGTASLEHGVEVEKTVLSDRLEAMTRQAHVCRLCARGGVASSTKGSPTPEERLAALELGKGLWVAKSVEAAGRWLEQHWRGFTSPLDGRKIQELLISQTGQRSRASLRVRLKKLAHVL